MFCHIGDILTPARGPGPRPSLRLPPTWMILQPHTLRPWVRYDRQQACIPSHFRRMNHDSLCSEAVGVDRIDRSTSARLHQNPLGRRRLHQEAKRMGKSWIEGDEVLEEGRTRYSRVSDTRTTCWNESECSGCLAEMFALCPLI